MLCIIYCSKEQLHTLHTQEKKMSSKPYELRASLLGQAEGILNMRFHMEYDRIKYLCDRDLVDPKTVIWPQTPSSEEILIEAEKLYRFVQTK